MKASKSILPTTKENPADAVVASHRLMIRAGLVRKSTSGLYFFLPLGLRILKKIESIVRQEMDRSGALEFELPILTPAEFWEESGRWSAMGKEMFRVQDRHGVHYALGPTHEESFSFLLKPILKSYKDLPVNVYQIHTKFRDEIRPRFGVIRSREFIMKDAYSFHLDDESLAETYELMRETYRRIFHRCGLETVPVQADSGSMGGSASEEFMVVSPIGEETLLLCPDGGYSSNSEKTPLIPSKKPEPSTVPKAQDVETPGDKTIQQVAERLGVSENETLKAVLLQSEERNILVFVPGDREVNLHKLHSYLKIAESNAMSEDTISSLGLVPGYIGPGNSFPKELEIVLDQSIDTNRGYVVGAGKIDYHTKDFVISRDASHLNAQVGDFSLARSGDPCPHCGKPMVEEKGIEVGHIFQLGKKYSEAFGIQVLDKNGKAKTVTMGCYGIGINRTMATIIEQRNDEKGIYWPISVAPYEVELVSFAKGEDQIGQVEKIYQELKNAGLDVFWDDRDAGPGFKLKDSELIGFPIRITVGKNFFSSGEIALYNREKDEESSFSFQSVEDLISRVKDLRQTLYSGLEG